jgi:hypothetical protein
VPLGVQRRIAWEDPQLHAHIGLRGRRKAELFPHEERVVLELPAVGRSEATGLDIAAGGQDEAMLQLAAARYALIDVGREAFVELEVQMTSPCI